MSKIVDLKVLKEDLNAAKYRLEVYEIRVNSLVGRIDDEEARLREIENNRIKVGMRVSLSSGCAPNKPTSFSGEVSGVVLAFRSPMTALVSWGYWSIRPEIREMHVNNLRPNLFPEKKTYAY